MIKFLILLFCLIVFSVNSYSQNSFIDSLKLALKKPQPDTGKLKILYQLAIRAVGVEAELYNEQLKTLAEKNLRANPSDILKKNYTLYLGYSMSLTGDSYSEKGDFTEALNYYEKGLQLFESIEHKRGILYCINSMANAHQRQGNLVNAIQYYEKALYMAEKDNESLAYVTTNMAAIYSALGNTEKALAYYLKSLKIGEETQNKLIILQALNNIGALYFNNLKDFPKALYYFKKSLILREELGDKTLVAESLDNIGAVYEAQQNFQKALEYYDKSLALYEEIQNKAGITTALLNIGINYESQNNFLKALEYYQKSLQISEEINYPVITINSLNGIGEIYYKQGNYSKALEYTKESLTLAKELGSPDEISISAKLLTDIYKKQNKNKEALEMHELYIQMRDSTLNIENIQKIANMTAQYEIDKVEKEKIVLAKENKIQELKSRYTVIGYSLLVVGLIVFGFLFFRQYKQRTKIKELKKDQELMQAQIKSEKLETEAEVLKTKTIELENSINSKQQNIQTLKHQKSELETEALSFKEKTKALEKEIDFKSSEFGKLMNHLVEKDQSLKELKAIGTTERNTELEKIVDKLQRKNEDYIKTIESDLELINSSFKLKLQQQFPVLSEKDLELAALLKLNLSSKEIAAIQNISPKGVDKARYRLRKKLNIDTAVDLHSFFNGVA